MTVCTNKQTGSLGPAELVEYLLRKQRKVVANQCNQRMDIDHGENNVNCRAGGVLVQSESTE